MSYSSQNGNIDSDDDSSYLFKQNGILFNDFLTLSNYQLNTITDISFLCKKQNALSIQNNHYYNNLKEDYIFSNSKENNFIKNDLGQPKKVEVEKHINNIFDIEKESKEDEISIKSNKKVLFNIRDSFSTKHQTLKRNEKENNKDIKESISNELKSKEAKPKIKHTKYTDDNMRRKCKFIVLSYVMDFINKKLETIYKFNKGIYIKEKQLKKNNKEQVSNAKINENKDFLKKTLKEIFSSPISSKYKSFPKNHNEKLINYLINEEDETKRIYFNKLFDLSFQDCLEHFSDKKSIDILKGLKLFKEMKNDPIDLKNKNIVIGDENYLMNLEYYINDYENILERKKPRKREKRNKERSSDE